MATQTAAGKDMAQSSGFSEEHHHSDHVKQDHANFDGRRASIVDEKSPGVVRMQAIASRLTLSDRIWLFTGVFIIAYAYGLDGQTRYTYQSFATSSLGVHSLLATINVVRSVIAAAMQPVSSQDMFMSFN